jgi:hypothetical protein
VSGYVDIQQTGAALRLELRDPGDWGPLRHDIYEGVLALSLPAIDFPWIFSLATVECPRDSVTHTCVAGAAFSGDIAQRHLEPGSISVAYESFFDRGAPRGNYCYERYVGVLTREP